jgi:hypothetical protein
MKSGNFNFLELSGSLQACNGAALPLFVYITRLASKEIFSPSNKIHREVGRAKDLSAPRYLLAFTLTERSSEIL